MRFLLVDDQTLVLEALGAYLARLWPNVRVVQATTVADALRHGHDVGDNAGVLEAPEVVAGAAEPGLDLVGDAHAAVLAHDVVGETEVLRVAQGGAADSLNRLGDERGHLARRREADDFADLLGAPPRDLRGTSRVGAAVGIGAGHVVDADTREPIQDAHVAITWDGDELAAVVDTMTVCIRADETLTDTNGNFRFWPWVQWDGILPKIDVHYSNIIVYKAGYFDMHYYDLLQKTTIRRRVGEPHMLRQFEMNTAKSIPRGQSILFCK